MGVVLLVLLILGLVLVFVFLVLAILLTGVNQSQLLVVSQSLESDTMKWHPTLRIEYKIQCKSNVKCIAKSNCKQIETSLANFLETSFNVFWKFCFY